MEIASARMNPHLTTNTATGAGSSGGPTGLHPFPNQCISNNIRLKSCEPCRIKKKKCDQREPCDRCAQKGFLCVYSKNSTCNSTYKELKSKTKGSYDQSPANGSRSLSAGNIALGGMKGASGIISYDSSPMLQLNMQLLPPGGIGLGGLGGPMVSTPLPVTPTGQLPGPVPLSQLPFQSHNMASHASLSPRLSSANLSVNVASLQSYAAAQGNTPTPTTHFTDISIEALLSPQAHSSSLNLNATDDLMNAILSPALDTQSSAATAFLFSPNLNPPYTSSTTTAFLDGAVSPQMDIMSSFLSPALDFHAHPTSGSTDQEIINQLLSPLFLTTSMAPTGYMQFDAITSFNALSPPPQLYTGGMGGGLNPLSPGLYPNPVSPTTGDPFALDAFGILGGSLELGGAPPLPPALAGGPVRSAVQAQVRGSGVRAVPYDVGERRVGGAAGRSGNPGDAITSVAPPAVGSGIKTGGAAGKKRPFDHLIKRLRQQQQQQTGTTGGAVAVGPSGDSVGAVESVSDARRGISGTAHRGNSGEPSRVPEFGAVLLEYPADDLLLHFN